MCTQKKATHVTTIRPTLHIASVSVAASPSPAGVLSLAVRTPTTTASVGGMASWHSESNPEKGERKDEEKKSRK